MTSEGNSKNPAQKPLDGLKQLVAELKLYSETHQLHVTASEDLDEFELSAIKGYNYKVDKIIEFIGSLGGLLNAVERYRNK